MNNFPILIPIFNHSELSKSIVKELNYDMGKLIIHYFPDEEMMTRIDTNIENRDIIFFATLERPIPKIFPLISASSTAKELGAKKIKLIVPYLPFMRQDKSFHKGEGITSKQFAQLLSYYFDEVITMDPHLHRFQSLGNIFSIPSRVAHAADSIADWIKKNVPDPLIIGPDIESKQWAEKISKSTNAPLLILEKIRTGDHDVQISIQGIEEFDNKTPILMDDIISTGETMIEAARLFRTFSIKRPICLAIHGIFSEDSYNKLQNCNFQNIVTCNTVVHETNQIDVSKDFIKVLTQHSS